MSASNLFDVVDDISRSRPGQAAVIIGDRAVTYGELLANSEAIAGRLVDLGVAPGARVGVLCFNGPTVLALCLASASIGAIVVPFNPALRAPEIAYVIEHADPTVIVVDERLRAVLAAANAEARAVVPAAAFGDFLPSVRPTARPGRRDSVACGNDPVALCYTSASTASPKGVLSSHASLIATTRAFHAMWSVDAMDRVVLALPLAYAYGLATTAMTALTAGATIVLLEKFDAPHLFAAVGLHRATIFTGVPTMYAMLADYAAATGRAGDLASLRLAISAGAGLPAATAQRWKDLFGMPISEMYGMSEIAPVAGYHVGRGDALRPGSVGRLAPGVEARIVDDAGSAAPTGAEGRLLVRSPALMLGYYRRPELTAAALHDGWFDTGDRAIVDDAGYYRIVGRGKDIINRGGLKVSPAEVEAVLLRHPAVREAAVLGTPDPAFGERVKAVLVLETGQAASVTEIRQHCRAYLADFKIPAVVVFVAALPVGATGKVAKRDLVDLE
jgi:long-chain acyl-CoA synthetase